jgi:glucose-6-phosphate isomerase
MTDIGTKGRRAILTAVGIALLSTSVFGGKFPGLLKDIAKIPQGGRSKTVNAEPLGAYRALYFVKSNDAA